MASRFFLVYDEDRNNMTRYGSENDETIVIEKYLDSHLENGIKQKNLDKILDLMDEYIDLKECVESAE